MISLNKSECILPETSSLKIHRPWKYLMVSKWHIHEGMQKEKTQQEMLLAYCQYYLQLAWIHVLHTIDEPEDSKFSKIRLHFENSTNQNKNFCPQTALFRQPCSLPNGR